MNRNSKKSLVDKVNEDLQKSQRAQNNSTNEHRKTPNQTGNIHNKNKRSKTQTSFFDKIKNNPVISNFWLAFFSSKHIQSKPLRYLDRFLKVSFIFTFIITTLFFVLIITSPNQFTKELMYRENDTIVYDAKNAVIGKISQKREAGENVENIKYDQFNQGMINAAVGTEDATFFKHNGFDLISTVENGFKTVVLRSGGAGGSAITQQIVGQTHLGRIGNSDKSRKIREIFLSLIGETQLTKSQIMESYLNYFEFGQGNIRGVELASKYFFNHSVYELDYFRSAILAGTLNRPSFANPLGGTGDFGYRNDSQDRVETVLLSNKNQGYLKDAEYYLLQQVNVYNEVDLNKKTTTSQYQAYVDVVANELDEKYGVDPFKKPLKVYTNMDKGAQKYANEITKKKHVTVYDPSLNFGFIVSRTQTGEVVALGGGKQYRKGGAYLFNNATQNRQQPGSAFKPIIDYSPTFEFLSWSDRTPLSNAAYTYPNGGGSVRNHDDSTGGVMTMDAALANSRNLTALRAMQAVYDKITMPRLKKYVNDLGGFGIEEDIVPAYGLGGLEKGVTPLQMNAAYQAFGNGGKYIKPFTIRQFEDEHGKIVKNDVEPQQVIKKTTAFMMSAALERSTTEVSGSYANKGAGYPTFPFAAKTGTSNWDKDNPYGIENFAPRDTWLVGYTSNYTMSSWAGYSDTSSLKKGKYPQYGTTHEYSANVWGSMMKKLANGKEKSYLVKTKEELPEGIEMGTLNSNTAVDLEAETDATKKSPYKKGSTRAYFFAGTQPTEYGGTNDSYDYSNDKNSDDDSNDNDDNDDNPVEPEPEKKKETVPTPEKKPTTPDPSPDPTNPGDGGTNPGDGGTTPGDGSGTSPSGNVAPSANTVLPYYFSRYQINLPFFK